MTAKRERVVLLHGLARTRRSMYRLMRRLRAAGFRADSLGYPSRQLPIESLAEYVRERLPVDDAVRLHFVTHSLGGIIVRQIAATARPSWLGRVVMLGPPNRGSRLAAVLNPHRIPRWVLGPALEQLAGNGASLPERLPPVDFELGVIAGTRGLPGMSLLLGGEDDGIVRVQETRVDGMADLMALSCTHAFMMNSRPVTRQVLHFLRHGRFDRGPAVGGEKDE